MRRILLALTCRFVVMVHVIVYCMNDLLQKNVVLDTVFYAVKRYFKRSRVNKKPGAETPDE